MPGLGGSHFFYLIIFLIIVLVIFGPGKLPEVGSGMGKAIREFKRATSDVSDSVSRAVHESSSPPPQAGPSNPVLPTTATTVTEDTKPLA